LKRVFGPRDPVTDATIAIEALRYKDSTKATRYTIEFNQQARRTGWNDQALARQYYKGLPDRLKDEVARIGKPATLRALQELVDTLDQRYWERQSEITRDKKSTSANQTNKPASSDNRSDNRSGNNNNNNTVHKPNSQQQSRKDQKKPSSAAAGLSSSSSNNKANTFSDILGPDGKLKPEERKHRMDNNLCLRCGGMGHTVSNCSQTKAKPKGRAANVSASAAAVPAPRVASGSGKV
jgi:hypothetical protein